MGESGGGGGSGVSEFFTMNPNSKYFFSGGGDGVGEGRELE